MTTDVNTNPALGIIAPETHLVRTHGPFQIRRIRPGLNQGSRDDVGFGGLGLIDHAQLHPGLVVEMHEHRNDEIISYLRSGHMQHTDTAGTREVVDRNRLMVMHAGSGFSHEEAVVGNDPIEMLQIFMRPDAADLKPDIQFVRLDEAARADQWRLLAGPAGAAAPSYIRQAIYLYDAGLSAGKSLDLPSVPGFDRWLYVFHGSVRVGEMQADTHTALTIDADETALRVQSVVDSDLVLFLIDRRAPVTRTGTLSR